MQDLLYLKLFDSFPSDSLEIDTNNNNISIPKPILEWKYSKILNNGYIKDIANLFDSLYVADNIKLLCAYYYGSTSNMFKSIIPKYKYEWKLSNDRDYLLIDGYCRNMDNLYNLYVPIEIRSLFIMYYGLYLNKIKSINKNDCIKSKLFKMYNVYWYITIYPLKDSLPFEIKLSALPRYQEISIFIKISLIELNVQKCFVLSLNQNCLGKYIMCNQLILNNMLLKTVEYKQFLELNDFTITLEMEILPKYEQINTLKMAVPNTNINEYAAVESKQHLMYEWKIDELDKMDTLPKGKYMKSDNFGINNHIEFNLRIYPKGIRRNIGDCLSLYLNISKFRKHIKTLILHCKFILKETMTEMDDIFEFNHTIHGTYNGYQYFISNDTLNEFKKLNIIKQLTFKAEITVIALYDNDLQPISMHYNPIKDILIKSNNIKDDNYIHLGYDERIKLYDISEDLLKTTISISNKSLLKNDIADEQFRYLLNEIYYEMDYDVKMIKEIIRIDDIKNYPIYRIIFKNNIIAQEFKKTIIHLNKKGLIDYNWYVLFWKNWKPFIGHSIKDNNDNDGKEDDGMKCYDVSDDLLKCTLNISNKTLLCDDNADKQFMNILNKTQFDRNHIKEILRIGDTINYPVYRIIFDNKMSANNFRNRIITLNKKHIIDYNWYVSFWVNWKYVNDAMRKQTNPINDLIIKYDINNNTRNLDRDSRIKSYDISDNLLKCTLKLSNNLLLKDDTANQQFKNVLNKVNFSINCIKEIMRIDDIYNHPIYRIIFVNDKIAQNFKTKVITLNKQKIIDYHWYVQFWINWNGINKIRKQRNPINYLLIKHIGNNINRNNLDRDQRIKSYDISHNLLKCTLNLSNNSLLKDENADKQFKDILIKTKIDINCIIEILRIDDIHNHPIYRIIFNNSFTAQNVKNTILKLKNENIIEFNWYIAFWMNLEQIQRIRHKNYISKIQTNQITQQQQQCQVNQQFHNVSNVSSIQHRGRGRGRMSYQQQRNQIPINQTMNNVQRGRGRGRASYQQQSTQIATKQTINQEYHQYVVINQQFQSMLQQNPSLMKNAQFMQNYTNIQAMLKNTANMLAQNNNGYNMNDTPSTK